MLIIILVRLLIFGGGFGGYYGYNRYGSRGGIDIVEIQSGKYSYARYSTLHRINGYTRLDNRVDLAAKT